MFTYKEHKIISSVPAAEITGYMHEIGASEKVCVELTGSVQKNTIKTGALYEYNGLEIKISLYNDLALPDLGIQRFLIEAHGDRAAAEEFLTAYRYRFLSAGG